MFSKDGTVESTVLDTSLWDSMIAKEKAAGGEDFSWFIQNSEEKY